MTQTAAHTMECNEFLKLWLQADEKTRRIVEQTLLKFECVEADFKAGRITQESRDDLIKQITAAALAEKAQDK